VAHLQALESNTAIASASCHIVVESTPGQAPGCYQVVVGSTLFNSYGLLHWPETCMNGFIGLASSGEVGQIEELGLFSPSQICRSSYPQGAIISHKNYTK
jgi:hypothetical protein